MALSVLNGVGTSTSSFTITLSASDWSDNAITINNTKIKSSGSAYVISPESSSYVAYTTAGIYASDVTTDNYITFNCTTTPTDDITVSILKVQVG